MTDIDWTREIETLDGQPAKLVYTSPNEWDSERWLVVYGTSTEYSDWVNCRRILLRRRRTTHPQRPLAAREAGGVDWDR